MGKISWQNSAKSIKNLIRGLAPKPGAYTFLKGKLIKIYRVRLNKETGILGKPGEIININKKHGTIEVATGSGSLEILELQPAGKRKMLTEEFLRGYQVNVGETFD
ncbi:MAG: hypothetical protein D6813_12015 [Calditrichaeota bacterium]|nr:MAG: hypothetical protein D6813_12015 [Calditrichota bacterium]